METTIPTGKHAGKKLSDLRDNQLAALYGSWIDSYKLKGSPLIADMLAEMKSRGIGGKHYRPPKPRFAKLVRGKVEAKCFQCGALSVISSKSWADEGIESKPKCHCGGMIYLADQSLPVTCLGFSERDKHLGLTCLTCSQG